MKKIIAILAAAAAIAAAAASCSKEITTNADVQSDNGEIQLNIKGVIDDFAVGDATKASLVNTIRVAWATGDKVLVFDESNNFLGTLTATVPTGGDGKSAQLSGTIGSPSSTSLRLVYSPQLDLDYFFVNTVYTSVSIKIATQEETVPFMVFCECECTGTEVAETTANFKFASSVVSTYISGLPADTDVSSITISGINSKCNLSLYDQAPAGSDSGSITLLAPGKTNARGQLLVEIAVPVSYKSTRTATVDIDGIKYSGSFTGASLDNGYAYSTMVDDMVMKTTSLPGVFTIKEENGQKKQVVFSTGNLWYDSITGKWAFEGHQYDYAKTYDPRHVSHFYWSVAGPGAAAESYDFSSCFSYNEFSDNAFLFTNGEEEDDEVLSWCSTPGSSISISGETGVWRTVSLDELQTLLFYREMENVDFKYTDTTEEGIEIEGVEYYGRFLYPDDYDGSEVSSAMTWADINNAGIVFLPAAGCRNGATITSNKYIYYWCDIAHPIYEDSEEGWAVIGANGNVHSNNWEVVESSADNGYAIRLVRDVPTSE